MEDIIKKAMENQDAFAESQDAEFESMKLVKESIQSGDEIDKEESKKIEYNALLDIAQEEMDTLVDALLPYQNEILRYVQLYDVYEANLGKEITPIQEERERQLFELRTKLENHGVDTHDIDRLKNLKQIFSIKEGLN